MEFAGVISALSIAVVILLLLAYVLKRWRVVTPNEALIIAGRKDAQGGVKVVVGGGVFVKPFIERAGKLSLEVQSIQVESRDAVTKQGIKVNVNGIVNVKIGDDTASIQSAAQRFLMSQSQIPEIVKNVLEGSFRAIIGTMTVEEIIRDRQAFAQKVQEVAQGDLRSAGLMIDTFTIQSVTDPQRYIEALGRPDAARVVKEAEIAEYEARLSSQQKKILTETEIANAQLSLDLRKQEIAAQVAQAEARAAQSGPLAEAESRQAVVVKQTDIQRLEAERREQELTATIRKEADADRYKVEQMAAADKARRIAEAEAAAANIRVTAEANSASIRLTAEAEAQASRVKGEGEASAIEATGLAEAQAMTKKADAFLRYNDAARLSLMLEKMPEVAAALASPLGNIGNLTVIGTDGASQVTGTVIKEFAQLNAAFKALTGYSFDDLLSKVTESKAQPEGNGATLPAEKS